jgi:hypothetical protein
MTVARETQETIESLSNVAANVVDTQTIVEVISTNFLYLRETKLVIETVFPYIPEQDVYPDEIASEEAFGTPTAENLDYQQDVYPIDIASEEAFGTPTIRQRPQINQTWRHGIYFCAGFDLTSSALSTFSMTFTKSGKSNITITASDLITAAAANKMFMRGIAGDYIRSIDPHDETEYAWTGYSEYNFMQILEAALNAKATAATWGVTFAVDMVRVDPLTYSYGGAHQYLSITTGVNGNAYLSALSSAAIELTGYTGACGPLEGGGDEYAQYQSHYILIPDDFFPPTDSSDVYEANPIGSQALPDSGAEPYGIERSESVYYFDWTLAYQTKSNTYTTVDDTYHNNGCDALFAHCRTTVPFVAIWDDDDTMGTLHYFRSDSAACKPTRVHPDDESYWNVEFKTICVGRCSLDD